MDYPNYFLWSLPESCASSTKLESAAAGTADCTARVILAIKKEIADLNERVIVIEKTVREVEEQ